MLKNTDVELQNVFDVEVSESGKKNEFFYVQLTNVVNTEVSESIEKKIVNDNGVSNNIDVEECAIEDSQNILEMVPTDFISNIVVETSLTWTELSERYERIEILDDTVELVKRR